MQVITEQTNGVSDEALRAHAAALCAYGETLRTATADTSYARPESALATPSDEGVRAEAGALRARFGTGVRTVLLVGIGGSDLGTRAIYDALYGHREQYAGRHTPRLIAYATVEPGMLSALRDVLKGHERAEEVVLIVISKSGGTTETVANANVLFTLLSERFGKEAAARQSIVITEPSSPLAAAARERSMTIVAMPAAVGGRYSVFSSVGLVPLALLGVDIRALCEGARAGTQAAAPEKGLSSAMVLAAILYEQHAAGLAIHELFLFDPALEMLGKWYRQLLAESIGKTRGDGSRVGITPTVAIGSTDLHSLGQLVFGGPQSRCTTFVAVPSTWQDTPALADDSPFMLEMLRGKTTGDVMQAIYGGVRASYAGQGLPFVRVELDALNERELGAFMTTHMAMVMYLARLLDVNAFDQPAVESYKLETKRILAQ